MPGYLASGLNVTALAYAQELKVAFKASRFIEQMAKVIKDDSTYQSSSGTQRDPTYIVKDKDGNVTRFWRTAEDVKRISTYDTYARILADGLDFMKPGWYTARQYIDGEMQCFYQAYNFLVLVSEAFTDLTCGGGVEIKTGIPLVDMILNDDLHLETKLYEWLFEASVFGFVGVQIISDEESNTLELQRILPHYLYPLMSKQKDNTPICISKKVWMPREDIPDWQTIKKEETTDNLSLNDKNFDGFVYEERHFKGVVEYYLWAVKEDQIVTRIPMKYFEPNVPDVQLTGLQEFAITIIPNTVRLGQFISDWETLVGINLAFNDRASRVGELLNNFAEPNLMVSDTQATFDPATGKVFYRKPRMGVIMIRPTDRFTPAYLQPNADMTGSESNLKFLLNMLATHGQISSVLFDPEQANTIESGVAYKLKLTPTLKKVNRRKAGQEQAIQQLIFNIITAINFYHDQTLVRRKLEEGLASGLDEKYRGMCGESINRLDSGAIAISLEWFDEMYSQAPAMAGQPRGFFTQPPAQAQAPEELQYLADENLLNKIDTKEREMQEIMRFKEIQIEMLPSLPQDVAMAMERLGNRSSMSLKRFLVEFDRLTPEQAEEEIQRITNEEATQAANTMPIGQNGAGVNFNDLGQPNPVAADKNNTQSDAIHAGTQPESTAEENGVDSTAPLRSL